jgi:DNA-binding transcriptional LysR family regulator
VKCARDLSVLPGNRDQVITDLDMGAKDVAIMGRLPLTSMMKAVLFGPRSHGLMAVPDHPLAGRRALSAANLLDELFTSREQRAGACILMTRHLDRVGDGQAFCFVQMGSKKTLKQSGMAGTWHGSSLSRMSSATAPDAISAAT